MQNTSTKEQVQYAGFWVRLCAYIIDMLVLAIPLLLARLILSGVTSLFEGTFLTNKLLFQYTLTDIVVYLLKMVYFVACTYLTGTTVGKKLLNLKVVRADGEEKLELMDVIYRETIGRFLNGISIEIGYILVGIDKEKRGFHDFLCDTRVIYSKKVKVYEVHQTSGGMQPKVMPQNGAGVQNVQISEYVMPESGVWHTSESTGNSIISDGEFERPWKRTDEVTPQETKEEKPEVESGYTFVSDVEEKEENREEFIDENE